MELCVHMEKSLHAWNYVSSQKNYFCQKSKSSLFLLVKTYKNEHVKMLVLP